MIRVLAVCLLFVSVASAAEVAPMPREVGTVPAESPAATAERIVRNAKLAGDRLAADDAGAATRKTQADILRDIDALLNRPDDPLPPMDKQDGKEPPPMGGEKNKEPQPKSSPGLPSKGDEPSAGRPKRSQRNRPMPEEKPEPLTRDGPPELKKDAAGAKAGTAAAAPKPGLPLDGDVVKDVWGHLPEQLRRQVSEYYRQQFMPQYAELLKQYYSSLAERDRKLAPER